MFGEGGGTATAADEEAAAAAMSASSADGRASHCASGTPLAINARDSAKACTSKLATKRKPSGAIDEGGKLASADGVGCGGGEGDGGIVDVQGVLEPR